MMLIGLWVMALSCVFCLPILNLMLLDYLFKGFKTVPNTVSMTIFALMGVIHGYWVIVGVVLPIQALL